MVRTYASTARMKIRKLYERTHLDSLDLPRETEMAEPTRITEAREAVRRFIEEGICPSVQETKVSSAWTCLDCRQTMPRTYWYDTHSGEWVRKYPRCRLLPKIA